MSISKRHNINILGTGSKTMLFAHGYGCDQIMWRYFVPAFQDDYRLFFSITWERENRTSPNTAVKSMARFRDMPMTFLKSSMPFQARP